MKNKLNQIFSAPNQRRFRKEPVFEIGDGYIEEEEEQDPPTQFSQTQKNQFIDLKEKICKDFATLFQSLASTAQKTKKFL